MVAFSKYFYQTAYLLKCNEVSHDKLHHSCYRSTLENFTTTIGGCTTFVLPLSLIPIVMQANNLNKAVFKQSLRVFFDSFLGAWLISGAGLTMICVLRNILGVFYYSSVLAFPSGIGAAICQPFLADRVVYAYAHGLSAIALQVSIYRGDWYIFKLLRNSRLAITLVFMGLNVLMMHGLRENVNGRFFWLTQPLKRRTDFYEFYEPSPIMDRIAPVVQSQIKCCEHNKSCDSYITDGIGKFLKFGLCVEIVRNIMTNYSLILKNPLKVIFKRFNWNLIMFLVGYVGLYRLLNCYANRHNTYLNEERSTFDHKIASFISGFTFYFYPNFAIFSHATMNIIEIYWSKYYDQIKSTAKWFPFDKMKMFIFPIVFGYVTHVRAFTPWLAPSMLKKLMHLTTNHKDARIYRRYHERLFGLEPQFFL